MALSTNQRMVWSGWSSGVTFWAWTASIAVHLIVLTALGFVTFSGSEAGVEQRPVPTAKISQIKKLVQAAGVIPKPKIKRPTRGEFTKKSERLLPVNQIFGTVKPVSKDWPSLAKPSVSMSEISFPGSANLREGIEFFGSFTDERKVCYVVDCSGSMQGLFGEVRKKLSESIGNLQPDQYFYIIFFGGDRLFEFGDGKLLRATEEVKSAAYKFIDSIRSAGQTNALAAFERAVQIRDSMGQNSAVVYFLTDGFELTSEDGRRFSQKVAGLLAKFAPRTRINTIGFWPQSGDREMLRTIARQSGGEFVLIDNY
ncbi:MAG: VWA domain-containing protein [Sedimentisphaerales bacterium]|nr:VWA domain-containing protein [Sedimentisphaerales bacterium]